MDRLHSILDLAEERIDILKCRSEEIDQNSKMESKEIKYMETCKIEWKIPVPKNGRKAIFKEITVETFPKFMKNGNLPKQETQ